MKGVLRLDENELVACVACGLCLPHCPTYRVTGLESASPRGRIAAMRAVELDGVPLEATFERYMEECVQCRGCEAACPSSVPFGRLMEGARGALQRERRASRPWTRRVAEWLGYRLVLPRHALLLALSWPLFLAQRLHLVPRRFALPRLSARSLRSRLHGEPATSADAFLFTGCVMDAWQRDVHRDALRVMHAAGRDVPRSRAAAVTAAVRCTCTPVASTRRAHSRGASSTRCPATRRSSSTARGAVRR